MGVFLLVCFKLKEISFSGLIFLIITFRCKMTLCLFCMNFKNASFYNIPIDYCSSFLECHMGFSLATSILPCRPAATSAAETMLHYLQPCTFTSCSYPD